MDEITEEDMRQLCNLISGFLPDKHGFIVFTFPHGSAKDRRMRYASNTNRKDAVNALKEWMIQRGYDEDWMRHTD